MDEAVILAPKEPPHTDQLPAATTQGDDNGEGARRSSTPSITEKKGTSLSGLLQQINNERQNRAATANPSPLPQV